MPFFNSYFTKKKCGLRILHSTVYNTGFNQGQQANLLVSIAKVEEWHLTFVTIPFSVLKMLAQFQWLMSHLRIFISLLDNIFIYSNSWLQHKQVVLKSLRQASLTANAAKCEIGWVWYSFWAFT